MFATKINPVLPSAATPAPVSPAKPSPSKPTTAPSSKTNSARLSQLRTKSFPLQSHNHGKQLVRVLKVDRSKHPIHKCYEYSVDTVLHSFQRYDKCFTKEDNTDLVATDTQKNTVYYVAKTSKADSPEQFAIDLCAHFMREYSGILDGVEAHVHGVCWTRHVSEGDDHAHAWIKNSPEKKTAIATFVKVTPSGPADSPVTKTLSSKIENVTILKTTQSGFDDYHMDKFTLLPPCDERCLSTELTATWTYTQSVSYFAGGYDFTSSRENVRERIMHGIFGPAATGVFSPSLQATIYDAACLTLTKCPEVASLKIDTPNKHYLPMKQLNALGDESVQWEDDVFVPTGEPSGTITCTVVREL